MLISVCLILFFHIGGGDSYISTLLFYYFLAYEYYLDNYIILVDLIEVYKLCYIHESVYVFLSHIFKIRGEISVPLMLLLEIHIPMYLLIITLLTVQFYKNYFVVMYIVYFFNYFFKVIILFIIALIIVNFFYKNFNKLYLFFKKK